MSRYTSITEQDLEAMLGAIGVGSVEDLFADIPESVRLDREIDDARAQGWAQAVGEREGDLNAVAAPVRGSRGELVAVLGVQGPGARFDEKAMARTVETLLAHAAAVSDALGWRSTAKEEA